MTWVFTGRPAPRVRVRSSSFVVAMFAMMLVISTLPQRPIGGIRISVMDSVNAIDGYGADRREFRHGREMSLPNITRAPPHATGATSLIQRANANRQPPAWAP